MTVERESDGRVAVITLNNPDRRNALNADVANSVAQAIVESQEDGDRAVLIRGAGPAFCAGADLSGGVYATEFFSALTNMVTTIVDSPLPVIADVQGPAVGAGFQLAMACDLRVFGDRGAAWVPAASLGFALDTWTHLRMKELVGGAMARNIMIGGVHIDAEQALSLGLAATITDPDGAREFAHAVAGQAPITMEHSKRVLNSAEPATDGLLDELFAKAWASNDVKEARVARKDGRAPEFQGT